MSFAITLGTLALTSSCRDEDSPSAQRGDPRTDTKVDAASETTVQKLLASQIIRDRKNSEVSSLPAFEDLLNQFVTNVSNNSSVLEAMEAVGLWDSPAENDRAEAKELGPVDQIRKTYLGAMSVCLSQKRYDDVFELGVNFHEFLKNGPQDKFALAGEIRALTIVGAAHMNIGRFDDAKSAYSSARDSALQYVEKYGESESTQKILATIETALLKLGVSLPVGTNRPFDQVTSL